MVPFILNSKTYIVTQILCFYLFFLPRFNFIHMCIPFGLLFTVDKSPFILMHMKNRKKQMYKYISTKNMHNKFALLIYCCTYEQTHT